MRSMVEDTLERVRAALKMPGVTRRALAEKAGIHRNTLNGCDKETWNPQASTLIALEPHLPPAEQSA